MAEKNFTVTAVVARQHVNPEGAFYKVYEISIMTVHGIKDTIEVVADELDPELINKYAQERANKLEAVFAL